MSTGYYTSNLIDIDINQIIKNNNIAKDFSYQFILHTEDDDIELSQIESYETLQDFNNNIGDYNLLTFNIAMGTYIKKIYPNRDNLTFTILKTFNNTELEPQSAEYKFVIVNDKGSSEDSSHYKTMSEEQLNKSEMKRVEAQVYLIELEALRNSYIDGTFKNVTVQELIGFSYAKSNEELEVQGNPLNLKIDIAEPDNDMRYNNLMIPSGILLQDLPIFLQNGEYGVYNGGCGTYLQKYNNELTAFVYPLYSTKRFENTNDTKLMIYNPGNLKLNTIENTWTKDGDIIKIVAGSGVKVLDQGSSNLLDKGESLVASRPEQIFNRAGSISDEGILVDNSDTLNINSVTTRKDGISKSRYIGNESNMYKQRTQMVKDTMATYQIPWYFSYPEIIYPGMPVCYVFEDESRGTVKLYGSVQVLMTKVSQAKKTVNSLLIICVGSDNVYNS